MSSAFQFISTPGAPSSRMRQIAPVRNRAVPVVYRFRSPLLWTVFDNSPCKCNGRNQDVETSGEACVLQIRPVHKYAPRQAALYIRIENSIPKYETTPVSTCTTSATRPRPSAGSQPGRAFCDQVGIGPKSHNSHGTSPPLPHSHPRPMRYHKHRIGPSYVRCCLAV